MKRFLSVALAAALMCSMLVIGAGAINTLPPMEEAAKNFDFSGNIEGVEDNDLVVEKSYQVVNPEVWEYRSIEEKTSYAAIPKDASMTIKNTGNGEGYEITFMVTTFLPDDQGVYERDGSCYMTKAGGFIDDSLDPNAPEYGGLASPAAGESLTFSMPTDGEPANALYRVTIQVNYPELDQNYYWYTDFMVDEAAVAKARAGKGATPVTSMIATPNASKVLINGKEASFDAYTINQNNYFKLRDIASALSGTAKQFEVTWNNEKAAIEMLSNRAYTPVGGELASGDGLSKTPVLNTAKVYLDGREVALTAYTINGNNYFKLRDLGQLFDFDVSWDGAVVVDTSAGYTAD